MKLVMKKFFAGTDRQIRGLKVSSVGFGGNFVMFAAKIVVGWMSGSIAVIIDSLNNLLDAATSVITIIGFKVAGRKSDHSHPHGYGRVEYVVAFVIALTIIGTALLFGIVAIQEIINPTPVESSAVFVTVLLLAMVGRGLMAVFYWSENRKIKSQMLAASGRDALADTIAAGVALLVLIWAPMTDFPVDGVAGVAIAVLILVWGGKLLWNNVSLLIGHRPDKKMLRGIRKIVLEKESFAKVEGLDFHDYGPESRKVLIKVLLTPGMPKAAIERDIALVQQELLSLYATEAILYWPPSDS